MAREAGRKIDKEEKDVAELNRRNLKGLLVHFVVVVVANNLLAPSAVLVSLPLRLSLGWSTGRHFLSFFRFSLLIDVHDFSFHFFIVLLVCRFSLFPFCRGDVRESVE